MTKKPSQARLGQPFTRWSIRELVAYLHRLPATPTSWPPNAVN